MLVRISLFFFVFLLALPVHLHNHHLKKNVPNIIVYEQILKKYELLFLIYTYRKSYIGYGIKIERDELDSMFNIDTKIN